MPFHNTGVHHENIKQHTMHNHSDYISNSILICIRTMSIIHPCIIIYRDTGEMISTDIDLAEIYGKDMPIKRGRLFRKLDFDGNIEIIQFIDSYRRDEYARVVK